MKVNIQKLPKSQLEITVELGTVEVEKYFDQAAKNLSKDMKIPGFRPGHIPLSVVIQNLGKEALWQEATSLALTRSYIKAILDNKIEAIGKPEIQIIKIAANNPFIYKAKINILPEIILPNYQKIKVKKKEVEIDQKEIEKVLLDLQKSRATLKKVDREVKLGDAVEIDFKIYLNKIPIDHGEGKNQNIIIGEKKFIPGFEEKLIGIKIGEKKDFILRFPKDYFQKNLADRDVEFSVEMKKVEERNLPKLDDDFAKSIGKFKDFADLTEKIEQNLKLEAGQKEKDRYDMEIMEKISEKTNFEMPEILVKAEIEKMTNELKGMVEASGGEFKKYLEHIKKTEDDLKKEFKERALKRVKFSLILGTIAKREKIYATPEEIKKEQEHTLKHYQHDPATMEKIQSDEYKDYLANIIQNRKVFEFLEKIMT